MAYAQSVEPVGNVGDQEVPDEIQEMHVYPPIEAPLPGRRKELRIPSLARTLTGGLLDVGSVMNRDITVSDVKISLRRVEVSCIVSSNYVKKVVIFCVLYTYIS